MKTNPIIGDGVFRAAGSHITGDVILGKDVSLWYNAVIRGDGSEIRIGEACNIQDNCVIHSSPGFPCHIGDGTSIGHGALIHGCSIGENTLIGMGSIILNGAKIGNNCLIGAGSLLTSGADIPDGMLAVGSPAKAIRPLTAEEIEKNHINCETYQTYRRENLNGEWSEAK